VISGQQHPLIPTQEPKVPPAVARAGYEAQARRFLPEQRRAPKRLQPMITWALDHHSGELP